MRTLVGDEGRRPMAAEILLDGVDILLVDDEEETLTMFRDSLEAAGARVRSVMTAADALREHDRRAIVPKLISRRSHALRASR
jgi:PleD family two-component response regulator